LIHQSPFCHKILLYHKNGICIVNLSTIIDMDLRISIFLERLKNLCQVIKQIFFQIAICGFSKPSFMCIVLW
jgi:hypothetical protein